MLENILINDYKKLIKNIANCMEIHSTNYRNYKISQSKLKNFENILAILQEEAINKKPEALNSLGFLNHHGIGFNKNKMISLEYFRKSAKQNDN